MAPDDTFDQWGAAMEDSRPALEKAVDAIFDPTVPGELVPLILQMYSMAPNTD